MAFSLTRFSWSLWGGGGKKKEPVSSNGSAVNSPSSSEMMKEAKMAPPSQRKVKRKWQSREERRKVDREYDDDFVLVPSDGCGGCLSGSESDDSDWSIGWLEPLRSDFQSGDDDSDDDNGSDDSFAVLVPCYRHRLKEVEGSNNVLLGTIQNLSNEFSSVFTSCHSMKVLFYPQRSQVEYLLRSFYDGRKLSWEELHGTMASFSSEFWSIERKLLHLLWLSSSNKSLLVIRKVNKE